MTESFARQHHRLFSICQRLQQLRLQLRIRFTIDCHLRPEGSEMLGLRVRSLLDVFGSAKASIFSFPCMNCIGKLRKYRMAPCSNDAMIRP